MHCEIPTVHWDHTMMPSQAKNSTSYNVIEKGSSKRFHIFKINFKVNFLSAITALIQSSKKNVLVEYVATDAPLLSDHNHIKTFLLKLLSLQNCELVGAKPSQRALPDASCPLYPTKI